MAGARIQGREHPIGKIFSDDFAFEIPDYQRPYSWTTEQAGQLLGDLQNALSEVDGPADSAPPYFLGSIVLVKSDEDPKAPVVDGQQRLTTMTILLAAMRSVLGRDGDDLTEFLYEQGNQIKGTPNRYRVSLRHRDDHFFRTNILERGAIERVREMDLAQLSDSQKNIAANARYFLNELESLGPVAATRLAQFLVNRCFLVAVSTPDLDSAYRIFSVLNDRGLDLSHADILKAQVIGSMPDDWSRQQYSRRWEDAEEALGRSAFGDLFEHIRMIHRRAKARESILREFREYVVGNYSPMQLIDEVIIPAADAYAVIRTASYESAAGAEAVNDLLRWLNRLDNKDWVPPAVAFFSKHATEPERLRQFLCGLERLAVGMMVLGYNVNRRIERYARVLGEISDGVDVQLNDSTLQLGPEERRDVLRQLNGDIYDWPWQRRLYVLLRLETLLSGSRLLHEPQLVTVEHVLPQNPSPESEWMRVFPDRVDRERMTHRLSNLVLLTRRKNGAAQNYDFNRKKQIYFQRPDIPHFALTAQVLNTGTWTPEVLERRQEELTSLLAEEWSLV
jgi:hypothetical protein